jgi:hypothetical protein
VKKFFDFIPIAIICYFIYLLIQYIFQVDIPSWMGGVVVAIIVIFITQKKLDIPSMLLTLP